jgi:hypothetical protein
MALEIVSEEKRAEGEAQAKAHQMMKALKAIPGSEYIYNRLGTKFEKTYDGAVYIFDPHETRLMPEKIARWFWGKSVISYEPVTGTEVRALVCPEDPMFGVPYDEEIGPELFDRSLEEPVKVDGQTVHAKLVAVKGGGYEKGKRIEGKESRL